ncbi:Phosphatidylinositol 4-kinase STT4 [Nakaseomyces bracarensis]|uniref:1-phosphatidylinositol 4-kinase n=1 Tax=Nakaseomyces bracarensis TaxID=273131 RepID=A0ABR4NNC4_9SACH
MGTSRSLRGRALEKLAQYAVSSKCTGNITVASSDGDIRKDIDEADDTLEMIIKSLPIYYSTSPAKLYTIPMNLNEWEAIVALCRAIPDNLDQAQDIIDNAIASYFLHAPRQRMSDLLYAKFKMQYLRNPNELITFEMTKFLIAVANKFESLIPQIEKLISQFITTITGVIFNNNTAIFSLLGFLNAFIIEVPPIQLTTIVWSGISNFFITQKFLVDLDNVLASTSGFDNSLLIQYYEGGEEICAAKFWGILSALQVTIMKRILNVPASYDLISEYLLGVQYNHYKNMHKIASKRTDEQDYIKLNENLRTNSDIIFQLIEFSIKMCEAKDYTDLSSDTRTKYTFNIDAHFCQVLAILPFMEFDHRKDPLLDRYIKLISASMEKYLLFEDSTDYLVETLISVGAIINFFTSEISLLELRFFPLLIASQHIGPKVLSNVTKNFTMGLKPLNEDAIVSTIYSINNLLALTEDGLPMPIIKERKQTITSANDDVQNGMQVTPQFLDGFDIKATSATVPTVREVSSTPATFHRMLFRNCVSTITQIASHYNTQPITALTLSILTQKVGVVSNELDDIILQSMATFAPFIALSEFSLFLKFLKLTEHSSLKQNNNTLFECLLRAKVTLSKCLYEKSFNSELYKLYLHDILESIIASGDVERSDHHRTQSEITRVADQIVKYLQPLSQLLPNLGTVPLDMTGDAKTTVMFRNIWFNMVVHGFCYESDLVKLHYDSLLRIAFNSPPLTSDFPVNNKELSVDMNSILRRSSSSANIKVQRQSVSEYFNSNIVQSRTISTTKIMFLASAKLVETIRCEAGDCSKVVLYLSDPALNSGSIETFINAMAVAMIRKYANISKTEVSDQFNATAIAKQLTNLLLLLSHREQVLQDLAFQCCDLLIRSIPSALLHHNSLYTLLDLLTTLFDSIVDSEVTKFDPHYEFLLKYSKVKILLPGSLTWRKRTLTRLHNAAKVWTMFIMSNASQNAKILLQTYISGVAQFYRSNSIEYGVSFAIDMAGSISNADKELSKIEFEGFEKPNAVAGFISQQSWRSKFLVDTSISFTPEKFADQIQNQATAIRNKIKSGLNVTGQEISDLLDFCAALLIIGNYNGKSIIYDLVRIPFEVFKSFSMKSATNIWLTVITERPDLAHTILSDVIFCWKESIESRKGLFSKEHDLLDEDFQMMEYAPYNKREINRDARFASDALKPHRHLINFFASHFAGTMHQSDHLLSMFTSCFIFGVEKFAIASLHPFARLVRNEYLLFGISILKANLKRNTSKVSLLSNLIVKSGLDWFRRPASWPFGSNELKIRADLSILTQLFKQFELLDSVFVENCGKSFKLLEFFIAHEIQQIQIWLTPLERIQGANSNDLPLDLLSVAYNMNPQLAVNITHRYNSKKLRQSLIKLIVDHPLRSVGISSTFEHFLHESKPKSRNDLHYALYWAPVSPLKSINLFLPDWNHNEFILQYSIFSLEAHDVNLTFFYVPQIVQCLRYDGSGYVERLILETAKISVLFSHQIIWNMLANCYKDDEATVEDEIKPILDKVRANMVSKFDAASLDFYNKEFTFFDEVTSISGKLKPYIKKSKAEKKQKIDEEMGRILVRPGVYLPSNPDGVVVDINRKSGKPLQSHAKAPFMATFKIKKDIRDEDTGDRRTIEKWQAAIFKVGDDCRQDLLALQLISLFRTIWSSIGLDVYVFPYRVTATAPGCGVIDVLPNSISRDMLGREAVNGLYEYFISKFGHEDSIEFQKARSNFVKSLAGYSVISYLLQFKDRHNGNIMYDSDGHCLHVDFGFIFDIVPGGVKFEAVPFKLTKEMVRVMGGSQNTQAYQDFEELCIKAYLAARPHMEMILAGVQPMLGSGLPCFKGSKTMRNLENRFQPNKTDQEAAHYMKSLINKSYESIFTKGYDEFQRLTNGIPY